MIDIEKIDVYWIEKVSKVHRNADKILVEKVIRAFVLLEGLSELGIPFVFKGGTSLMLLTDSSLRLSIDIDIVVPPDNEIPDERLEALCGRCGFTQMRRQERAALSKVPKCHYKFFYQPAFRTLNNEDFILLDILYDENPYGVVEKRAVASSFVPFTEPSALVNVPAAEELLGDKLTAFAPNTTGVPYQKHGDGMGMEIVKQLYDIGCLFDISKDIDKVRAAFAKVVQKEIGYRNNEITPEAVLEDIFQTALCISTRGVMGNGDFEEIQGGISRVKGFVFSAAYHIEHAIVSAAKAAYLSTLIASSDKTMERYRNPSQNKDLSIDHLSFNKLGRLKRTNPEAFFYWQRAIENYTS